MPITTALNAEFGEEIRALVTFSQFSTDTKNTFYNIKTTTKLSPRSTHLDTDGALRVFVIVSSAHFSKVGQVPGYFGANHNARH